MQMHCHMNTALFTALFIIYYNYYYLANHIEFWRDNHDFCSLARCELTSHR